MNSGFRVLVLLTTLIMPLALAIPAAFAVRSPEHYENLAHSSKIKAIAIVKEIKALDESKQATRKEVVFQLEKGLGNDLPQYFRGTCFSVDHSWQDPGVGGTIYYYPQKDSKVLVTVSSNGGAITSYTTLSPELEAEIRNNGLANISFAMGRAAIRIVPEPGSEKQWFSFHLDGKPVGYFSINRHLGPESETKIEFTHELLVGELDGDRVLYKMTTLSREDATLTPERLKIEMTEIT